MNAKEKAWEYYLSEDIVGSSLIFNEKLEKGLKIAIQEAKKEVFDDIGDIVIKVNTNKLFIPILNEKWFKEIKQRHLSTFPKEKQHNYRKIQYMQ